jgi:hypothetical protein
MLMSPVGLRPERRCAGDAQGKLKITEPSSRRRGRPTSTNPQLRKIIKGGRRKIGRGSQMGACHQGRLTD